MSTVRAPIKTFDYQCPDCGSIIRIPKQMTSRNRSRSVEGHIKDIWCYVCQQVTKHIQLSEYERIMKPEVNMDELIKIEHKGQRVLTTQQLAECYETETSAIINNFNRNFTRYQKGIHYFELKDQELQQFKASYQNDMNLKFVPIIILWTEKGALLHAKSLGTDKAWQVYEMLVDTYFRAKELSRIKPLSELEILQKSINLLVEQEKKLQEHDKQIKEIKETVVYRPDNWRDDINKMFDRVARANDNRYRDMRAESYRILEERAGCDLDKRLENLQQRKKEAGATSTEISRTNKLDVIESDPKLREIYTTIIKELVIKYVA